MEVNKTELFDKWFKGIKDPSAFAKVSNRIDRASTGNLGDCKPVGNGVSEMRIHYGQGYRLYFSKRHNTIIFLAGGTKKNQNKIIQGAIKLWQKIK